MKKSISKKTDIKEKDLTRREKKEKRQREKRRRNRNRTQKPSGVLSILFCIVSIALILDAMFLSWNVDGNAGWNVGVMGAFALLSALTGWVFALAGKRDLTAIQTLPKAGSVIATVLVIVSAAFWGIGFVLS